MISIWIYICLKGTSFGINDSNQNKMNHTVAIKEIIKVVPECEIEFQEVDKTKNSFMVIKVFTKHIKSFIGKGDIKILLKSLNKMNDLYTKGDPSLRNAIENVFIYSLDSLTFPCKNTYKTLIFSKIPKDLNRAYLKQVYKSGI